MKKLVSYFILCFSFQSVFASQTELEKVLSKYWNSTKVSMHVKKTIKQELLMGREKITEGTLIYSKGRLKLVYSKPENSEIVIDIDNIWLKQKVKSFGKSRWQVSKIKKSKVLKKSQTLLGLLFADNKMLKKFVFVEHAEKNKLSSYVLRPKNAEEFPGINKLAIVTNSSFEIELLRQWDNLGNEISYRITKSDFHAKFKLKQLDFVLPKNAELLHF